MQGETTLLLNNYNVSNLKRKVFAIATVTTSFSFLFVLFGTIVYFASPKPYDNYDCFIESEQVEPSYGPTPSYFVNYDIFLPTFNQTIEWSLYYKDHISFVEAQNQFPTNSSQTCWIKFQSSCFQTNVANCIEDLSFVQPHLVIPKWFIIPLIITSCIFVVSSIILLIIINKR